MYVTWLMYQIIDEKEMMLIKSIVCGTWLMHMCNRLIRVCDETQTFGENLGRGHDFKKVTHSYVRHSFVRHDSRLKFHSLFTRKYNLPMNYSCVQHDSRWILIHRFTHMCCMTPPCAAWLIRMCDMTRSCATWLSHMRGMTHSYVWRSCSRATRLGLTGKM